jgi:hypothetical protein
VDCSRGKRHPAAQAELRIWVAHDGDAKGG